MKNMPGERYEAIVNMKSDVMIGRRTRLSVVKVVRKRRCMCLPRGSEVQASDVMQSLHHEQQFLHPRPPTRFHPPHLMALPKSDTRHCDRSQL